MIRRVAGLALLAISLVAQTQSPTIRGTITEYGVLAAQAGVGAAQVAIYEFVTVDGFVTRKPLTTVITGANGTFSYEVGHLGDFYVEVAKDGYATMAPDGVIRKLEDGAGTGFRLSEQERAMTINLMLVRPAQVSGQLVDEDGKPIANMTATLMAPAARGPGPGRGVEVTDASGMFQVSSVIPGRYIVRIAKPQFEALQKYDEATFNKPGVDFESSYWPGGVTSQFDALPLDVPPGITTNLGVLRIRNQVYYRIRVKSAAPCAPGETWMHGLARAVDPDPSIVLINSRCGDDLMLNKVEPGSYYLSLWAGTGLNKIQRWSLSPVTITNENVEITAVFQEPVTVAGRVRMADDSPMPKIGLALSLVAPNVSVITSATQLKPDEEGKFRIENVPWPKHRVMARVLNAGYYVKEIIYDRQSLPDRMITLTPGGELEIVLDDHAPIISGKVFDGDRPVAERAVLAFRAPLPEASSPLGADAFDRLVFLTGSSRDGDYRFQNLPPGDYRLISLPRDVTMDRYTPAMDQFVRAAPSVTVARGEQKTVDVKVTSPR